MATRTAKKTAAPRRPRKKAASRPSPEPETKTKVWNADDVSDPMVEISFPLTVTGKQIVPVGTTIEELGRDIHAWAVRKGWRGPEATDRHFSDEVALIASEVFEALEAWRDLDSITDVWPGYTIEVEGVKFKDLNREQLGIILGAEDDDDVDAMIIELNLKPKMMGVAPELADLAIRLFETCAEYEIDLLKWVQIVMAQNEGREFLHGGKPM